MDIEKTISFILDTQAKTEAILQSVGERQSEAETRMSKSEARMDRFDRRMRFYIRAGARQMSEIRATQARTDIVIERLSHRLDKITEHLDEVTGKLDALIVVVDGVVRRPGSSPGAA